MSKYFQISDGRIWSTDDARFVSSTPDGVEVVILCRAEGPSDEACLRRSLESLGYKIGYELMTSREEAESAKLQEIKEACETALSSLVASYPERELHTFERQEREARAWLAGAHVSDVTHIKAISSERGIELNDLARKIVAKADTFAILSGRLIGRRQALEDKVKNARSKEEITAIEVLYDVYT